VANRYQIVRSTLEAEFAKPYVYGESDCFFLGCRMADALDGSLRLVERYWRSYSTLLGAQRALRRRGFTDLPDLFASHLTSCGPAEAALGDIAVLQFGNGQHVAVCLGRRFVTRTEAGLLYREIDAVAAAFRTGGAPCS